MTPELNKIYTGDCVEHMRSWPDQFINSCVTSPPYYGLRDYGHVGQIGLEATPEAFVSRLVEVFREVKRVLRDDGTLWLNLGDSYAANRSYQVHNSKGAKEHTYGVGSKVPDGLKSKDLIGIPWMVAAGGKQGQGYQAAVVGATVRRLTVVECERLQSFADNYTLIPWDATPREAQDRAETVAYLGAHGLAAAEADALADTPDGHRYKGLGNSMCGDVMLWIGKRIEAVEEAIPKKKIIWP